MDDLISRKALLEELDKWINPCVNYDKSEFLSGIATAISEVEAAPAVDAAPVMHGRWKWTLGKPYCECCAIEPYRASNNEMPNYCPNCGAKMNGGNDNDCQRGDCSF